MSDTNNLEELLAHPKLVDAKTLAFRYGVAKKTIMKWASTGFLPSHRLSRRCTRFDLISCDAAIEKRRVNAKS